MNLFLMFFLIPILFLIYFIWRYSFLIPAVNGLPILMYHKVSVDKSDFLTITTEQLETHFAYLQSNNYTPVWLSEFVEGAKEQHIQNPILISFDDAYLNNLWLALPVLKKWNFKATVFIPTAYIGKVNFWDEGSESIMNFSELLEMHNSGLIEFGIHSNKHQNYKSLSADEIEKDLVSAFNTLSKNSIPFFKALAYPYGAYHRKDVSKKLQMFEVFKKQGLLFALRIGNRINCLPLKTKYELKRIDVRGNNTFFEFKIQVRKGRTRLF